MINKFIVIKDKVIVFDEYSNTKTLDYIDNILEILKQENNIEIIEKVKDDTEWTIEKLNDECSHNKAGCFSPLIAEAVGLGAGYILLNIAGLNEIKDIIFGQMSISSFTVLSAGTFLTPFLTGFSLQNLSDRKKDERRLNALKTMKIFVDDKLDVEKEKLKELKKHNSSYHKNSTFKDGEEVIIEPDYDFYMNFDHQRKLYYNTVYNEKKYKKYLQKGNLENKLPYYTDDDIDKVKKILKRNKTDM